MTNKSKKTHDKDCECDKPEIRDSFDSGCSEEQIRKCHGHEMVEKLKAEGKL